MEDLRVASAGKLWRYYDGLCQKEGEEKEQKEGDEKEKGEEEQHPSNPATTVMRSSALFYCHAQ